MKIVKAKTVKKPRTTIKTFELIGDGEECTDYTYNLVRNDVGYARSMGAVRDTFFGTCPRDPRAVYYSHATGGLFSVTASTMYLFNVNSNTKFSSATTKLTLTPFFADMYIDGKCVTVSFSGINRLVYDGKNITESKDEHEFYTGVMHGGRFFARDYAYPLKLWWSASHALDWTEGIYGSGYIHLSPEGGNVLRLISFGDKLLAVRQNGITVVRALGEPQHFRVDATATYAVADGIVGETCAVCAGKLYFATKSGIYTFDGSSVEKCENRDGWRISAPVMAVASGDCYYLICTDKFLGEKIVFGYDTIKKHGWFINANPSRLFTLEEDAYFVYSTGIYKLCATDSSRGYWRSKNQDFGTPAVKFLRRLYIDGDDDVNTTIVCGDVTREFIGNGWITVNMYARTFRFVIGAFNNLTRVRAEVEVRNGI